MNKQIDCITRLEILQTLPAKEALMLVDGVHYDASSDYPSEYLSKSIDDLINPQKAQFIYHRGRNLQDDKIWEDCREQ